MEFLGSDTGETFWVEMKFNGLPFRMENAADLFFYEFRFDLEKWLAEHANHHRLVMNALSGEEATFLILEKTFGDIVQRHQDKCRYEDLQLEADD